MIPPPPSRHLCVGSEMTILIIKYCKDSLSTAGMKTSQARRGGHRQKGSLKHLIQCSAYSPSLLRPLNSPLKKKEGEALPPFATPSPSSARLLSPSPTAVSAPEALDKASINCRPVWNTHGTMGPTECPAPRQGWKQVVQESSRID